MLYLDIDGTHLFYSDTESDNGLVSVSDAQTDILDVTSAEILISDVKTENTAYSVSLLVLSVLQLFVLMVIALFTIVRRTNND